MNDRSASPPVTASIGAVERDTGLSKDTLRVWERRYGFPSPGRDAFGERAYPLEQVDKLRIVRRLMDLGHRPGRIIGLPVEQLQQLAASSAGTVPRVADALDHDADLQSYLALVKQHRIEEVRRQLSQAALKLGLARFVTGVVAPLNELVGEAWARGWFEIFEEHLYTEAIQVVLRSAINSLPPTSAHAEVRPRVLLTTFPQEQHGLGLLMAEALFAMEGARCISLGVQTPVWDITLAAGAQKIDIVALSFSATVNANHVLDGLSELRALLAPSVQIWAGGSCPALRRRPPAGVRLMPRLDDIAPALDDWRSQLGSGNGGG